MQEMLQLYQQFYDLPVSLPSQLVAELGSGNTALETINQQVSLIMIYLNIDGLWQGPGKMFLDPIESWKNPGIIVNKMIG